MILNNGAKVQLAQGDITRERLDAIVNAANSRLQHGAGVAGAIVRKGGPQIQVESDEWVKEHGPVTHQAPAYTNAGRLPCRIVIHAVGPVWGSKEEDHKLSAAVCGSLDLAEQLELKSIALPAISTGIYGFPKDRAAKVIIESILNHFNSQSLPNLQLVRLVIYDDDTLTEFTKTWENIITD